MRCPKCRTLTWGPAMVAGDAGSLVRCPRCAATWIARVPEPARAPPMVRRGPVVIDAEPLPAPRSRRRFGAGLFAAMAGVR